MTDDIIRSMKEQMVPSDDVISDLLAKIAAFEAVGVPVAKETSEIPTLLKQLMNK